MSFSPPALITAAFRLENFDCGKDSLNQYLKKFALKNTNAGTARTYVTTRQGEIEVAGYYSLAAGSLEKAHAPERVSKGTPNHPIPVVLIARLAIDKTYQGQGLGKGLLRDALLRVAAAADVIGVRAVLVHAKDSEARQFYEKWGFVRSPTNELHLMLLMKDLRRTVGAA
ncbi:MAG: GNAT family N-acetyltransferase [Limisphaerales bacterium]